MNHAKNFIVWANEEDHIRIISMQKGASLKQVWSRLVRVSQYHMNAKVIISNLIK